MSEINVGSVNEVNNLNLKRFDKLPSGWQRVVIAIVFIVILVGVVLLRQMVQSEEDTRLHE